MCTRLTDSHCFEDGGNRPDADIRKSEFLLQMIQLIRVDTSCKVPCPIASNPMLEKLKGLKTGGGVSLQGRFPDLVLTLKDDAEAPSGLVDFFTVGLLRVVSAKLRDVFNSVDGEFEYFPVTVLYEGVSTKEKYYIANPLVRIDAVDVSRSDVEIDPEIGDVLTVKKLVLDESRFIGHRIALIREIGRLGVIPHVAEAVSSSGCIGITFVDPATVRY